MHEDTVYKPLSELEAILNRTSTGDMLLFLIALDRAERARPWNDIVIGFND